MVLIDAWDDFLGQAESLFQAEPTRTRYVIKYRHQDNKLVMKVTDDRVCLKFETDEAQELKKILSFSAKLTRNLTHVPE